MHLTKICNITWSNALFLNDLQIRSNCCRQGQKVLQEFTEVMQRTRETMSVECKIEWWQKRFQLDEKLKVRLRVIRTHSS